MNDPRIRDLLTRAVSEIIDQGHLAKQLASGKKLRVKLGIDPTSPNLHIGRAVVLWKLRQFQELGHHVIFIVGDGTGVIGDTSDKETERPIMTREQLTQNMKTYAEQAFKILDKNKTEVRFNSEWLSKLGFFEIGEMADLFSWHEFSAREVIARRVRAGKRISLREVLYPIMQGYDSVAVKADVELGGTDQRFNLLAGRDIQKFYGQEPQDIMTTELLEGTDGRKMSSSWGNVINITNSPRDMFGKVMSINDELIPKYFELCTRNDSWELEDIKKEPRQYKISLAKDIITLYHSRDAALKAADEFINIFSEDGVPEDIKTVTAQSNEPLVEILLREGIVSSKTEFNRLNKEGAIKEIENGVYRIGKHRFLRIEQIYIGLTSSNGSSSSSSSST